MKHPFYYLFLFVISGVFSACHHPTDISQFERIAYGTAGGECAGYCSNSVSLDSTTSVSIHNYFDAPPQFVGDDKTCTEDYAGWNTLIEKIDIFAFKRLPDRIGCPGCSDAVVEWIEISYNGETYRVAFERPDEPDAVSDYIGLLRSQLDTMIDICL